MHTINRIFLLHKWNIYLFLCFILIWPFQSFIFVRLSGEPGLSEGPGSWIFFLIIIFFVINAQIKHPCLSFNFRFLKTSCWIRRGSSQTFLRWIRRRPCGQVRVTPSFSCWSNQKMDNTRAPSKWSQNIPPVAGQRCRVPNQFSLD